MKEDYIKFQIDGVNVYFPRPSAGVMDAVLRALEKSDDERVRGIARSVRDGVRGEKTP
jgi:hypothetical protein